MQSALALQLPRANYVAHPAPLSADQVRFLALHARAIDPPMKWQWHFGSTLLRATTDRGHTASLGAEAFDELVRAGLVRRMGFGAAITEKGREAAK